MGINEHSGGANVRTGARPLATIPALHQRRAMIFFNSRHIAVEHVFLSCFEVDPLRSRWTRAACRTTVPVTGRS